MSRRTGFIWHEAFAWLDYGNHAGMVPADMFASQPDRHAYDPEIARRFRNLVEMSGLSDHLVHIKPTPTTKDTIARVHQRAHIEQIKSLSSHATGGVAGPFMPIPPGAFETALLAAGGAIAAADAVMRGGVDNAYALLRPAGHHATPDQSMGFCIFSNAAG